MPCKLIVFVLLLQLPCHFVYAQACADSESNLCPHLSFFCWGGRYTRLMNSMCRKTCNCCSLYCRNCFPDYKESERKRRYSELVQEANKRTAQGLSNVQARPQYYFYLF